VARADYGGVVTDRAVLPDAQPEVVTELAARLVAGDPAGLEAIYDRWAPLVHTYALRVLLRVEDAEDVTQQVFLAAWRGRSGLNPGPSALPAWLLGIARHKVADRLGERAREARRVRAVGALPTLAEAPDLLERLTVRDAVEALPPPRDTLVRMAFWEGLTHAEISEQTGLPLGTVKSHVRRGLLQLHRVLEEVPDGPR